MKIRSLKFSSQSRAPSARAARRSGSSPQQAAVEAERELVARQDEQAGVDVRVPMKFPTIDTERAVVEMDDEHDRRGDRDEEFTRLDDDEGPRALLGPKERGDLLVSSSAPRADERGADEVAAPRCRRAPRDGARKDEACYEADVALVIVNQNDVRRTRSREPDRSSRSRSGRTRSRCPLAARSRARPRGP